MSQHPYDSGWVWLLTNSKRGLSWILWGVISLLVLGYLLWQLTSEDKRGFLPGKTSIGHHQFEIQCQRCHDGFAPVKNSACLECHSTAWQQQDVHPPSLWQAPLYQPQLAKLDATQCTACHREHRAEVMPLSHLSSVTVPVDFCQSCHADTPTQASHQGFSFEQCSTCHQYHRDQAMQPQFLEPHRAEADTDKTAAVPRSNLLQYYRTQAQHPLQPLTLKQHDAPETSNFNLAQDWEGSSHAQIGVNCTACHQASPQSLQPASPSWLEVPPPEFCKSCHATELAGFLAGSHGIRTTLGLPTLHTELADLPMKPLVKTRHLSCVACHSAHAFKRQEAAVEACLECHHDNHSRAYKTSPHYPLWQQQQAGTLAQGQGVSCATCHMPREVRAERVVVEHNISANLRSEQPMVTVCIACHGLAFSLDSLATERLHKDNFSSRPAPPISIRPMLESKP